MSGLLSYTVRRLLGMIPLLLLIITLAFFIMRFSPGGPFDTERPLAGQVLQNIQAKYRLDRPLFIQYLNYLGDLFTLDLGVSMKYRTWTVKDLLFSSFLRSSLLGGLAILYALAFGLATGFLATLRKAPFLGRIFMGSAILGISVPNFLLGSGLIIVFAFIFPLFPVAGWGSFSHLVLPAITLGTPFAAFIARIFKRSLLEVHSQDFIRTAEAKGLEEKRILFRHGFRLALVPVLSFLGPAAAGILTGSVVVEKIFAIPGMGTHFVNGAFNRDYPLVLGAVLLYGFLLLLFNFLVDLFHFLLDPRVRDENLKRQRV